MMDYILMMFVFLCGSYVGGGTPSKMERGSYFSSFGHGRLLRLLEREGVSRPRQGIGETVIRCMSFMQFFGVCFVSLITVVTPWMLVVMELVFTMVIYFSVVPHPVKSISEVSRLDKHQYSFEFGSSLEDILISSILRVVVLGISFGLGSGRCCQRPYYHTSIITSSFLIPYVFIKGIITSVRPLFPAIMLLTVSAVFSIVHVVVAHATMKRATRRWNMGLVGFGYPWEDGDDGWVMSGRHGSIYDTPEDEDAILMDMDVPREVLQDPDSKFIDCSGISVHYKEEIPGYGACADRSFAVVLIHGFGGGVFAWRHLMRPLAEINGCRVVALDRPAFGLTSRPAVIPGAPNPYSLTSQRQLIVQFCNELGIKRAVLIGHSDGCVLAMMVAAALRREPMDPHSSLQSRAASISSTIEIGMSVRKTLSDHSAVDSSEMHALAEKAPLLEEFRDSLLGSPGVQGGFCEPWTKLNMSVASIILLHPDLSCEESSSFTNLLMQSKIGRKFLRPLLRSDMGEVANRRAWYDTTKLTNEVLHLYKAPLRILGWDSALVEHTRMKRQITKQQIGEMKRRIAGLPVLVVTGEKDRIATPETSLSIAEDLRANHVSVLPECGHISHEESPEMLLEVLVGFVEHMSDIVDD